MPITVENFSSSIITQKFQDPTFKCQ